MFNAEAGAAAGAADSAAAAEAPPLPQQQAPADAPVPAPAVAVALPFSVPPRVGGAAAPAPARRALSFAGSTNAQASLVFLAYTALYVYIGAGEWPLARAALRADAAGAGGDDYAAPAADSAYQAALRRVHQFQVAAALIHVANAVQYLAVWPACRNPTTGAFWRLTDWVQAPEWLNLAAAALSLAAAALADTQQVVGPARFSDGASATAARLELAGAVLQAAAVVGWAAVWWATHARGAGRGATPADPEFLAVLALFPAAAIAVAFRAAALQNPLLGANPAAMPYVCGARAAPRSHRPSRTRPPRPSPRALAAAPAHPPPTHSVSDYVFFASAVLYVLASLRDEGFFGSLLPTAALSGGGRRAPPTAAPPAPALAGPAGAAPSMPAAFSVANPMRAPGKRPAEDGPAPPGEAAAPHAPEYDKLSASL